MSQRTPLLAVTLLALVRIAHAQRANENAVAEASDAFGTAIGREVVGLYTAGSARGFSPVDAGNLRISGLYYDQVRLASLSSNILRGSTVHVGISAQGFPFPAPTGVVDYQLRTPAATPGAHVSLGYGSYDHAYGQLDVEHPLGERLSIGAGLGYGLKTVYKFARRTDEWTAGTIAHWQPTDAIEITPFYGATIHRERGARPVVYIGHSGIPRFRPVQLPAQSSWARWGYDASNFGATVRARMGEGWLLEAGAFRSAAQIPIDDEVFLTDTNGFGQGDYSISESPPHSRSSTSGEIRLVKRIVTAKIRNSLYFNLRGLSRTGESGGSDIEDLGSATTRWAPIIPKPDFHTGPMTVVSAKQMTPGIAYEGVWRDAGQVSLGVQRSFYERTIAVPGTDEISTRATPWLYNAGAAYFVTRKLIVYASSTRGFEELGRAPLNAANRDEVLPAQMTRQVDGGIKYLFTPSLQLVAGVFKIDKPYFDLDATNFFRQIGTVSNRGVEVSFSGALTERFTLVTGLILIDPKVERETGGPARATAVAIGPKPASFSASMAAASAGVSCRISQEGLGAASDMAPR